MICECGCGQEFSIVWYRRRFYSAACQVRAARERAGSLRRADRFRRSKERAAKRKLFLAAQPAARCPVCLRLFQRSRPDEVYDRIECRKKAQNDRRKARMKKPRKPERACGAA